MAQPNNPLWVGHPAVVVALEADVQPVADALRDRLERRLGGLPLQCQIVSADPESPSKIRAALNIAADIRNSAPGFLPAPAVSPGTVAPQVVIIASAVSLTQRLSTLKQLVREVRREFRRSRWYGHLYVQLYLGPVGNELPDESVLPALRSVDGIDAILAFGDTDGAGWRVGWNDAVRAASQFLTCQLTNASVLQMVYECASSGHSPPSVLAFGVCRLDLAEASLRRYVRERTCRRVVNALFSRRKDSHNPSTPHAGKAITDDVLASVYRATNGSLAEVLQAIQSASDRLATLARQDCVDETARRTRQAALALLPSPPPQSRGWFSRIIDRLPRPWRVSSEQPPQQQLQETGIPKQPDGRGDQATAELAHAERIRLQILQLQDGLCDGAHQKTAASPCPFDLGLADLPKVRETVLVDLPPLEQMAWQMVQRLPLPKLLNYSSRPARLREALEALVDQCLGRLTVAPEAYREAVEHMAAALAPLWPDCTEPAHRLALLPSQVLDLYTLEDYRKTAGYDDEIALLVVQPAAMGGPACAEVNDDQP